ncbi:hypothetical protein HPCPY1962_0728 [Helicobacter pylori CPY1962]|nr:hypothetical protein HPCPY1962_0728 [Helicobacter pylori CPY1962]
MALKKPFFKYLIRILKDYPIHCMLISKLLRINLCFKFCDF